MTNVMIVVFTPHRCDECGTCSYLMLYLTFRVEMVIDSDTVLILKLPGQFLDIYLDVVDRL